jgi:hypothetical protein
MDPAPPKISPANTRAVAIVLSALAVGLAAVVFFFNPAAHNFYPVCQFHRLTGLNCPGCGGTRAFYALLHGHFATALRDNALLMGALIFLAARGGWFGLNRYCGRTNGEFFPAKFLWWLLLVMLAFTVLRNLPAFAFLSP